jgi:hypothetical protein
MMGKIVPGNWIGGLEAYCSAHFACSLLFVCLNRFLRQVLIKRSLPPPQLALSLHHGAALPSPVKPADSELESESMLSTDKCAQLNQVQNESM